MRWDASGRQRRRRRAARTAAHRLRPQRTHPAVRGHHLPRGAVQVGAEQDPRRVDAALPVHRQRLPRLLARVPVLLRPAHPRVPGFGLRSRLRHPGRGEDQRRRRAAARTAPAVVAAGDRRAGDQYRPVSARRGPLRVDAGHHRRAHRFRHPVLHPDQGHVAPPRSAAARPRPRGGSTSASRCRLPSAIPSCTATSSRERRRRRPGSG